MLSGAPIQAQNPAVTSCGLPAGGLVTASVTYSLSGDCNLTSILDVGFNVSLTINGNGHSISASDGVSPWIFANRIPNDGRSVTLNQVTLDAQVAQNAQALNITNLTASQVTFKGNRRGIWDVLNNSHGPNWSLTNVLFLDNTGSGFNNASALEVRGSATLTMNNVAFVNNSGGSAAVEIDGSSAAVTATGCFTYVANYPRTVLGSWTDSSTGQCSGTLGNGYQLDIPRAQRASCGFPTGGYLDSDVAFTLSNNCQLDRTLHISEDITVTINGNDHKIQGSTAGRFIRVADGARLNINDAVLEGLRFVNYGQIEGQRLVVTGTTGRILYNYGTVNLNKLMLKDLDHSAAARNNAVFAYSAYGRGGADFRDSIFMNVNNGSTSATLWAWGATINLNGCISFINNSPANTLVDSGGSVNDNSSGPCPDAMLEEFPEGLPARPSSPAKAPRGESEPDYFYRAPVYTCPYLPPRVRVEYTSPGVQCQIVDEIGVGKAEVIAEGLVDAVDVWAYPNLRARVCFRRHGRTVLLNAAHAPRTVEAIPSYKLDGMTCVNLDREGTVVLLYDPQAGQGPPQPSPIQLGDCMVTTNYILNLRDAPGGEVLDMMPYNITLTALEQQAGWYKVDFLGLFGWVSADYVTPRGACG